MWRERVRADRLKLTLKVALEALERVQGADEHDGQYDGCSLCHYHSNWDAADPKWGHLASHEPSCEVGNAIALVRQVLGE